MVPNLRRQIHILHVDDDPAITDLTATVLEQEDSQFTVETAGSADEGVEIIAEQPIDCVVSDYDMPGMDGIEFLEKIREEYPNLPFILFTGKGSEAVASDAIAAGVTDYLQKQSGTEQYELLANRIRNAVTAKRETQRADRHEQLMRLTEFAGDTGGFEMDVESGEIIFIDGAQRLLDLPEDPEPRFETGLEEFHPDDLQKMQEDIDRALRTGKEITGEFRYQPDYAEEKLLEITWTPEEPEGETTILRGAIHDITDRTERQRKLRQIETLFQHAQDALFLIDVGEEFTVERVNPAWEDAAGLSVEQVRRKTPTEIFGEQYGALAEKKYRECIQREEPIQYEETARIDGEHAHWMTRIAPVVVNGMTEYIVGSTRDITEQKAYRQELERSETIVEALTDAVYVLDEEGRFTYVNEEFVELVGYDRKTILGSDPSLIKDQEAVDRAERELGRLLSSDGPETVTFEVTIRPRTGDPIVCEDHMGVLPYDGETFNGSVGVLRDITQHKQYERELEAKNERLEEFASIVSHDLRNPLGVAEGHLELASGTDESEHIVKAADAIERSQALIDDLLTLAREGDQVDDTEPVDLSVAAENSWETVETPRATLDIEHLPTIEADRGRLQQLLENLYRNSVEHGITNSRTQSDDTVEHGGDGVIVRVGELVDGFYVADTGSGIPESERDEIFDAGYSTADDGTGFGLRIVEQIVEAHGWDISVTESEQGGARFEITGVKKVE